ncbi:MAG: NAD(P)H-binding protein [Tenericutes bacterium]|nr:NAD(P)H-binding protein [Mycoplasmatota bacterium]
MKVLIVGGTGLLGLEAVKELVSKGHKVVSIALPPVPKGVIIPKENKLILKNYMEMSDNELVSLLSGCDGLVFAAGIDERIEGKAPIYDMYYKYNNAPLEKLIELAKQAKVRKIVVLGSYFSYFNRTWKELDLYNTHPYIRSRVDQANMALSFGDDLTTISVLELPYIFGVQENRKSVWVFLVEQIKNMKGFTFYPKGGTAMITARQVGKLITNVLLLNKHSKNIPVGYYNLTWKEMLHHFHDGMGIKRKVISMPKWMYKLVLLKYKRKNSRKGLELGLEYMGLAEIMSRNAFIDSSDLIDVFKLSKDNIEKATIDSVKQSLNYLKDNSEMISMKYK